MSSKIKSSLFGLLVLVLLGLKLLQEFTPGLWESDGSEERVGDYVVLSECRLVDDKYNDGDSFKIKTGDGRTLVVRIYFVDAPESRDKPYADHRKRVKEQGRYFGGLDYEESLVLGKRAKDEVVSRLKGKTFKVYTTWEEVYDSGRYYAFVELADEGWWHEYLVRNGLGRIHTKGEGLPTGGSWNDQRRKLRDLEKEAKARKAGGWGM